MAETKEKKEEAVQPLGAKTPIDENAFVAAPTQVATNETQVPGGRYKVGKFYYDAKGNVVE